MIGKHIKELRLKSGLNLKQLAAKLGKEYNQYSKIENGRVSPSDETLMDILVVGLDKPYSEAKNKIAQWKVEEALSKAPNPSEVINNIVAGDNSIVITGGINGGNNTIGK